MKFIWPVLLGVVPAGLSWLTPAATDLLLYDRSAILQGEWWRLWTGHWVHFTLSHLAWNAGVLLGAGTWLERVQPGSLLRYILLAAPLMSIVFLIGEPAMHRYGGLSGLVTGVVVLLALAQLTRGPEAAWWGGLLVLVTIKIGFDTAQDAPLFAAFDSNAVRSSGLAHALGAVTAFAFFLSRRRAPRRSLAQRPAAAESLAR